MESDQIAKKRFQNAIFTVALGILLAVAGYTFGQKLAEWLPRDQLLEKLGLAPDFSMNVGTIIACIFAFLYIVICLGGAGVYLASHLNPEAAKKSGVLQQLGGGERGRKSVLPLVQFYCGNSGLLILLIVAEIWTIQGLLSGAFLLAAAVMGFLMITSSLRLWQLLDELIKVIWVEAMAIAGGIFLVLALVAALAAKVGFGAEITSFQAIVIFHVLYFVVYFATSGVRAPETLRVLEDEPK